MSRSGRIRLIFTPHVLSGLGRVLRIIICLKRNTLWHKERPYCTRILIRWDLSMLPDFLGGPCVNPTLGMRKKHAPAKGTSFFPSGRTERCAVCEGGEEKRAAAKTPRLRDRCLRPACLKCDPNRGEISRALLLLRSQHRLRTNRGRKVQRFQNINSTIR